MSLPVNCLYVNICWGKTCLQHLQMTMQTPATAEIETWLRIQVPFFTNYWLRVRKHAETRRILPESTPALRIHGHLWLQDRGVRHTTEMSIRGALTQIFSSLTPVLMQEVGILILIRILFAIQLWNPDPEKILLTYLTNQRATIKIFCF